MLRSLQGSGALVRAGGGSAYDPYVTAASGLCPAAMLTPAVLCEEGILHLSAVEGVAAELLLYHLSSLLP